MSGLSVQVSSALFIRIFPTTKLVSAYGTRVYKVLNSTNTYTQPLIARSHCTIIGTLALTLSTAIGALFHEYQPNL
jgi:hypothetical protein